MYPHAGFNDVLHEINGVRLPVSASLSDNVLYAVLELVNNSLRACREKNSPEPIILEFSIYKESIEITITDWGGGFDVTGLPFDLSEDPDSIDLQGESFQNYRQKHGYKRFGMGLYVTRKTFSSFSISFFDDSLMEIEFTPGETAGTKITLGISVEQIQGIYHA